MVRAYRFVSLDERDVEQWLEHAALPLSLDERDMEQWSEHAALPLSLDEREVEQWLEHAALCRLMRGTWSNG